MPCSALCALCVGTIAVITKQKRIESKCSAKILSRSHIHHTGLSLLPLRFAAQCTHTRIYIIQSIYFVVNTRQQERYEKSFAFNVAQSVKSTRWQLRKTVPSGKQKAL